MAKYQYHYYGVKGDYVWHLASNTRPGLLSWWQPKIIEDSDLVWCQGIRGGVRLVYQSWANVDMLDEHSFRKMGYITTDPEAMKEFAWIKLRAVNLN